MMARVVCAVVAAGVGLLVAPAAPGRLGLVLIAAAPGAGFVVPDLHRRRVERARIAGALRELPDMLDLLRVSVDAGQAPVRALAAVGGEFDGPLAAAWRRVALLAELGEPLDLSLGEMEREIPCEDVVSFSRVMQDARRHGTPLGSALGAQAARARDRQRARIREAAARAGPKVQLVVALVLVPSALLFVAAALVANVSSLGLGLPY
jgi:tight adherence protein C